MRCTWLLLCSATAVSRAARAVSDGVKCCKDANADATCSTEKAGSCTSNASSSIWRALLVSSVPQPERCITCDTRCMATTIDGGSNLHQIDRGMQLIASFSVSPV